jgi:hypothetical protein
MRAAYAWDGGWSDGARPRLVVTPARGLPPTLLSLAGSYLYGNKRTRITANGTDLGWHQLDQEGPIALPAAVRQAETLEIALEHEAPHSPGPAAPRTLAFFLPEVSLRGETSTAGKSPRRPRQAWTRPRPYATIRDCVFFKSGCHHACHRAHCRRHPQLQGHPPHPGGDREHRP